MEWIVTTGKTVEEAKDQALDQLGVAEDEAEFEVVDEPKPGLFGRMRREARVRARVRPVQPRPKVERRRGGDRKRRGRKDEKRSGGDDASSGAGSSDDGADAAASEEPTTNEAAAGAGADGDETGSQAEGAEPAAAGSSRSSKRRRAPKKADSSSEDTDALKGAPMSDTTIPLAEHARRVEDFVSGLVDAFDLEADISVVEMDDETAEVQLEGENLGILIGRSGATLQAVQTLARSAIQRHNDGSYEGRVFVEVSGYRQRRREALEKFTLEVIEQVRSSGNEVELEPMGSADRKVVHDTANEVDDVRTSSVGEEPRRRVVITPVD